MQLHVFFWCTFLFFGYSFIFLVLGHSSRECLPLAHTKCRAKRHACVHVPERGVVRHLLPRPPPRRPHRKNRAGLPCNLMCRTRSYHLMACFFLLLATHRTSKTPRSSSSLTTTLLSFPRLRHSPCSCKLGARLICRLECHLNYFSHRLVLFLWRFPPLHRVALHLVVMRFEQVPRIARDKAHRSPASALGNTFLCM